ncbi:MAG TPA: hypothetical protein DEQ87_20600 [Algoriphagus sp.]|mgnify:CR=1 FL=1|jgi:mannose/cellobiose epimerase-like protein (N-acyl-D-glucosamine 2-epimerase family)|uniref:Lipoprotein n=1 Tax=Algoriphagus ornithinivorans TaxID=226506 RepID=A0A1I5F2S9_9BACT|nr:MULTISPECIES: hypothetical protein [Algoriphagus]MAL15846.1 hypothetical protein [Algoriphagus sp.]MAN88793.1 hypothetical protein [Algoriphagus sp.]QYH40075.1 hypothetical protein GYM62_15235 [Algoriphagus sp. NBT04N3]SFO18088.1 hypothetical protein SAMN04488519_104191 [Algoriphagus ornithinivorans]HAH37834.1 hypothetical protein [Algoriphagus sp.]|tara:strand:- start:17 stop:214 length:198 start_codon:yes stop_codon:yes gene_type:complete
MKKVFAIFAIAGLMATASCGNKEVSEEATEVVETVEETTEETVEAVEETTDSVEVVVEETVEEVK